LFKKLQTCVKPHNYESRHIESIRWYGMAFALHGKL